MKWIEKNFYIPETRNDPILRGRIGLQEYQRDVIREALRKDENGNYPYSIIVWSDIKKSAKSTIAAAINLYRAEFTEFGEFYIIANDLKQADSRVAHYLRRALQLNPNLRKKYSTRGYRTTSPNGSFLEAIPIDPSGEAGSNADMITFCLDEETQILTRRGWLSYNQIRLTDHFATQNPDTGMFEWQPARGIFCHKYDGEMWLYETDSLSVCITPGHRVYGRFSKNDNSDRHFNSLNWELKPIEDALKYEHFWVRNTCEGWTGETAPAPIYIPGTAFQEGIYVPIDLWAAFMGWYLSEGCLSTGYENSSVRTVLITQSEKINKQKHDEIISLLYKIGFSPKEYDNKRTIAIHNKALAGMLQRFGLSGDKYIPDEIKDQPKHILEIFLDAYIKGDGTKEGNRIMICTKSRRMAGDLAEIAQKCGYYVSDSIHYDHRWKGSPSTYRIRLAKPGERRNKKARRRLWRKVPYYGHVWCPSTANGIIYVRRGGNYYWTGNSELWGANESAKQTMWAELTLSPTKYGRSFRLIESYAGYAEESLLLWSLYEIGVRQGKMLWPDKLYPVTGGEPTPLELFVNQDAGMLCLWNTQPRCPWQTPSYYRAEEQILPQNDFLRMHRNQWVSSTETFVPLAWFDACRRDTLPEIDKLRHPVIIALDAGTTNDNFALFAGCRHPQFPSDVMTLHAQVWKPEHGKIDFQGTDEKPGPEKVLRWLLKQFNVIQVTYDPFQLFDMANRMKKEGLTWFKPFNQGQDRLMADSQLRDLIRDRRFWHRGEPDLREHIQNANAQIDPQESKIRIVKRVDHLKVDLAVAASMCSANLLYLNI